MATTVHEVKSIERYIIHYTLAPSPDLSPRIAQRRAIRGERGGRMGRNADPGRREGLLPSRALGSILTPL